MRTVTINFETASTLVDGVFTPAGYRVTFQGQSVDVPASPAVINVPSSLAPGNYSAQVAVIDTDGTLRGTPFAVPVALPAEKTAILAPISGSSSVVVS